MTPICPCGGEMKPRVWKGIEYPECRSCGRNDYAHLARAAEKNVEFPFALVGRTTGRDGL